MKARVPLGAFGLIGAYISGVGFIIEALADYQKWQFKKSSKGKSFCNVGVWSVSQHPNYFGNLLGWTGLLLMNLPHLIDPVSSISGQGNGLMSLLMRSKRVFFSLLSPAFMALLFWGQARGSIANTVQLSEKKYGHLKGYQDYVRNTGLIIPGWK